MLFSSLWNLKVSLISSPRTLLLSLVMSFSITVRSKQEFRRIATSGNTAAKLADNSLGSTGYRYSSTTFHYGKGVPSSFSVPHDRTNAYKASIFSGFLASPSLFSNTNFSFLLLLFSSPTVSTVLPSSEILDSDLPVPQ